MILKKITLNNIRSYKSQEVTFPDGSILLSGDIGAGKTSVLLAIEFALFGLQPGQRGNAILKNGENSGGVKIEFEIDEKRVIVERNLRRGKTITQDYCAISIDGEKKEYSVTELKDKVLEILDYPKEFSKKQNLLYRFTVYTPQEEMKQIILEDAETRVNTLRHVFGIDKYKKILENTAIITSKLREEMRIKEALIDNLEQDRVILASKEDELEAKHYNLVSAEKELFAKTEERKRIQDERDEISKKIDEKRKLQQEVEKTKLMILNKKDSILTNTRAIDVLSLQISELSKLAFDEAEIPRLESEILASKKEKDKLSDDNLKVASQIASLNVKNNDFDVLRKRISKIEICPTCLQNVEPVYRSNVVNQLDSDTTKNAGLIQTMTLEKEEIIKKLRKEEELISSKERRLSELKILKIRLREIDDKKKRSEETEKLNFSLQKDLELLNDHIGLLNSSVFEMSRYDLAFEEKKREFELILKEERSFDIRVAELRKEIEVFSRQIDELRNRIRKTEEIREKLNTLSRIESWLSKDFSTLVSTIEKNVMIKLKGEFSKLFAKWFSMLVSDIFEVRLDEDFTPIIQHQDYEIDYSHLSGGERTAIALAYRLALNQVIHSLLSNIKTKDLVILDEPTDGFSDQQLDKMRDVLRQLEVKQLIIVSHEQKIEGFVENVIRFKKEGGISEIAAQT